MSFKNYCIIAFENIEEIREELSKISEIDVNCLGDEGITICTFSSIADVGEIEELLRLYDGSFFVFELDKDTAGWHISDEAQYNHLFGSMNVEMKEKKMEHVQKKKKRGANEYAFSGDSIFDIDENDVIEYYEGEDNRDLINKILDKGADQLTDKDKELLKYLTNNNDDENDDG